MRKQKRFTLIELLVVIAIIAVLAGMLMPALGSAKNKALAIQCINQQKQVYYPLIAYADDNNDYSVLVIGDKPTTRNTWALMLWGIGYMKGFTSFDSYRKANLVCPSIMTSPTAAAPFSSYYGLFAWPSGSGVSKTHYKWEENGAVRYSPIYKRITHPGEMGLLADSWQNAYKRQWYTIRMNYTVAGAPLPITDGDGGVATAHSRQANMLMMPGNVRQWDAQQLSGTKKGWDKGPFVNIPYYYGLSYK